jgi:hypothetical protein
MLQHLINLSLKQDVSPLFVLQIVVYEFTFQRKVPLLNTMFSLDISNFMVDIIRYKYHL